MSESTTLPPGEIQESVFVEEGPPQTPVQPRITTVDCVYYQAPGEQPVAYNSRAWRGLSSNEQPYQRRISVVGLWSQLDTGWVTDPGMILIANPAPVFQKQPSADELAFAQSKIIEVGVIGPEPVPTPQRTQWAPARPNNTPIPFMLVRPGETARISPPLGTNLAVRCQRGDVKAILTALPS